MLILFQNATKLEDSFHRVHTYLRISLTERCNLRCKLTVTQNSCSQSSTSTSPEIDSHMKFSEDLHTYRGEGTCSRNCDVRTYLKLKCDMRARKGHGGSKNRNIRVFEQPLICLISTGITYYTVCVKREHLVCMARTKSE